MKRRTDRRATSSATVWVVSSPSVLRWARRLLVAGGNGAMRVVTFAYEPVALADLTLHPALAESALVNRLMDLQPTTVVFLSDQATMQRDARAAEDMRAAGVAVYCQSLDVCRLGTEKHEMKSFLQRTGINVIDWRLCHEVDETIASLRYFGAPVLLKHPSLSDGRLMRIATSPEDVEAFYYDFAYSGPVIVEPFVEGHEYSCAVLTFGTAVMVGWPVSKGLTAYLLRGEATRGRRCVIDPDLDPRIATHCVELATSVAAELGSTGIIGVDIVSTTRGLRVIEVNTRYVETLRMMSLAEKRNVFSDMVAFLESGRGRTRPIFRRKIVDVPSDHTLQLEDVMALSGSDEAPAVA